MVCCKNRTNINAVKQQVRVWSLGSLGQVVYRAGAAEFGVGRIVVWGGKKVAEREGSAVWGGNKGSGERGESSLGGQDHSKNLL